MGPPPYPLIITMVSRDRVRLVDDEPRHPPRRRRRPSWWPARGPEDRGPHSAEHETTNQLPELTPVEAPLDAPMLDELA